MDDFSIRGGIEVGHCLDDVSIPARAEEGGFVNPPRPAFGIGEDTGVVRFMPNEWEGIDGPAHGLQARFGFGIIVEAEPEHHVRGGSDEGIHSVGEGGNEGPIDVFAVGVAAEGSGRAHVVFIRVDAVGEVAMKEVEFPLGVGARPLGKVGEKEWVRGSGNG